MVSELVTAIIPSYNYGRFVCDAVDSVLAQSYRHVEVIVVDDGSKDDTRARLGAYAGRIHYIYHHNKGLSAARNRAIEAAHGSVIALLDADDRWHPQKLELQMRYLLDHPEIGLLGADNWVDIERPWPSCGLRGELPATTMSLDRLVVRAYFGPSSAVMRRGCLDAVGGFDTHLRSAEDRDMWIRMAARYGVAKLDLPLVWYRNHSGSMSRNARVMEDNTCRMLLKSFRGIPDLRGRLFLKWKALSHAAFTSSCEYMEGGYQWRALRRVVYSMARWPLPFRREEVRGRYARFKRLGVVVARALGVARSHDSVEEVSPGQKEQVLCHIP